MRGMRGMVRLYNERVREDQAPLGSRHHPSTGQGGRSRGHAGHTQRWYGRVWYGHTQQWYGRERYGMAGYGMVIPSDGHHWDKLLMLHPGYPSKDRSNAWSLTDGVVIVRIS